MHLRLQCEEATALLRALPLIPESQEALQPARAQLCIGSCSGPCFCMTWVDACLQLSMLPRLAWGMLSPMHPSPVLQPLSSCLMHDTPWIG